jgi:hypothetical protein
VLTSTLQSCIPTRLPHLYNRRHIVREKIVLWNRVVQNIVLDGFEILLKSRHRITNHDCKVPQRVHLVLEILVRHGATPKSFCLTHCAVSFTTIVITSICCLPRTPPRSESARRFPSKFCGLVGTKFSREDTRRIRGALQSRLNSNEINGAGGGNRTHCTY